MSLNHFLPHGFTAGPIQGGGRNPRSLQECVRYKNASGTRLALVNKIYLKQADFLNNAGRDRALTLSKVHKTFMIFNEESLRHTKIVL